MKTFLAAAAVRHPWMALAALAAAVGLGGLVVTASGLVPIKASAGHWAITESFMHFAMRRSVVTHALLVDGPPAPLDDRSLVLRGAAQFETGCRPCHGSPGTPVPEIPGAMTPTPPALSPRIPEWTDRQLFYLVKHGLKFTGMPGWPVQQRDDEVWAMVAFLRKLPGLDGAAYQELAHGGGTALAELMAGSAPSPASSVAASASPPGTPPDVVAGTCARCHGLDGNGRGVAAFPRLAGQRAEYLRRALRAYAEGRRHSGIMGPIAAGQSEAARTAAVQYYSSLPLPSPAPAGQSAAVARGRQIATRGIPDQEIPSCVHCHGPRRIPVNDAYPRLAAQYPEYIAQQLTLLQARKRGGSEYVHLMHAFVDRLRRDQIEDVAAYFASLDPGSHAPAGTARSE